MNKKIKELKRIARGNITGNYVILFRLLIFVTGLPLMLQFPFLLFQTEDAYSATNIAIMLAQLLIQIAAIVLTCGQYKVHLSLARTHEIDIPALIEPLRNQPDRYILSNAILFGLQFVASIPAILGMYLYQQSATTETTILVIALSFVSLIFSWMISLNFYPVFFLLVDQPELGIVAAFKEAQHMMHSHKKCCLYMQCSFLGIYLLCVLSLGIGLIWAEPYMIQTTTLFYLDVKGELASIDSEPTVEYFI